MISINPRNRHFLDLLLRWGPALLWMGVIFFFSANQDPYRVLPSNWETTCLTFRLGAICQDESIGRISHFSEYAILVLLICRGVFWRRSLALSGLFLAAGLAYGYALLDEIHQLFVAGRTFQLFDLGLDGLGILFGLLVFALPRYLRGRTSALVDGLK